MLECFLRLAIVVEAKLVNGSVVNSPGVTDVPLLESLVGDGSETGHIRPGRLKLRKWRDYVVIIEVVVETEVLFVIDAMIEPHSELVATGRLHGNSLNEIEVAGRRGERNKLQQVDGGWVEAFQGNFIGGKDVRVVSAIFDRNRMASDIACSLLAARPLTDSPSVQQCVCTAQGARKG